MLVNKKQPFQCWMELVHCFANMATQEKPNTSSRMPRTGVWTERRERVAGNMTDNPDPGTE